MRNKKGIHSLEIASLVIGVLLIVASIFLFTLFTHSRSDTQIKHVALQHKDYLTKQLLRTFAETPIIVDGKSMTVAHALNEYYSAVIFSEKYKPVSFKRKYYTDNSVSTRRYYAEKQLKYKTAIEKAAGEFLGTQVAETTFSNYLITVNLSRTGVDLGHTIILLDTNDMKKIGEGKLDDSKSIVVPNYNWDSSIQLPLYLHLPNEFVGEYTMTFSLVKKTKDLKWNMYVTFIIATEIMDHVN